MVDTLYCCLFLNFSVAWLIYGNTFHYSDDSIHCKNNYEEFKVMWILMMIAIAFGYLVFLMYGFLCCIGSCLCCVFLFMRREIELRNNPVVARVPYLNAVSSLNRK